MNKNKVLSILIDNNEFRCITKDYSVSYEDGIIRITNNTGEISISVAKTSHPTIIVDSAFTKHKAFVSLDWAHDVISELNQVVSEIIYDVLVDDI